MTACPRCGEALTPGVRFCDQCGAELSYAGSPYSEAGGPDMLISGPPAAAGPSAPVVPDASLSGREQRLDASPRTVAEGRERFVPFASRLALAR